MHLNRSRPKPLPVVTEELVLGTLAAQHSKAIRNQPPRAAASCALAKGPSCSRKPQKIGKRFRRNALTAFNSTRFTYSPRAMSFFGQTKRYTPTKPSRRAPLPIFTTDPEKKYGLSSPLAPGSSRWFTMLYVPLPRLPFSSLSSSSSEPYLNGNGHGVGSPVITHHRTFSASTQRPRKYARICVPIPPRLYGRLPRFKSARRILLSFLAFGILVLFLLGFRKRGSGKRPWTLPLVDPDTLVLTPTELAMIWEWEILSGHHPSIQPRE